MDAKKKKILMVRVKNLSKKRVWTFPKGHPEGAETDREAALREVQEETGWKCQVIKPISFVHYDYRDKNILFQKSVRWFLMKSIRRTGSFDPKEILECQWIKIDEAAQRVKYDSDKGLLVQLRHLL